MSAWGVITKHDAPSLLRPWPVAVHHREHVPPRACAGIVVLTCVRSQATVYRVKIRNFAQKGLKRLYFESSTKGVPPDTVDKLR
jgi:hypothetical protein